VRYGAIENPIPNLGVTGSNPVGVTTHSANKIKHLGLVRIGCAYQLILSSAANVMTVY
jgi:hypothetical protein